MYFVSLLLPAFSLPANCDIALEVGRILKIQPLDVEVIEVKSIECKEFAVKLKNIDISLQTINELQQQNERLTKQLQSLKKQLMSLSRVQFPQISDDVDNLRQQLRQSQQLNEFYVGCIEKVRNESNSTIKNILSTLDKLKPAFNK